MADYLYTGEPTSGKSTKDIKVPKADGSFEVFVNITPNITMISVTDAASVAYLDSSQSFSKQ